MKELNAIITIAFRDVTKLFRDRTRIIASFIFPLIFVGVLGSSLQSNIAGALGYNFITFVFIGTLGQTLFQSTAAGLISLIEDRQNDFAQELFVAPISRTSILAGKILGETMVAFVQMLGLIIFGLIIGIPLDGAILLRLLPFSLLVAFFGGAFGVLVMANLSDQKTANQIFPFLLFPQFFLAGVFNPIKTLPLPLLIASRIAPMTYAVDLVRSIYYLGNPAYDKVVLFNPLLSVTVIVVLSILFVGLGTYVFVKRERER